VAPFRITIVFWAWRRRIPRCLTQAPLACRTRKDANGVPACVGRNKRSAVPAGQPSGSGHIWNLPELRGASSGLHVCGTSIADVRRRARSRWFAREPWMQCSHHERSAKCTSVRYSAACRMATQGGTNMKHGDTKRKVTYQAWWFTGEEICVFCSQRHSYHTRFICVACDRPVCPHCATRSDGREIFCPHCFEEEEK
jgi:hypothetical protein